MLTDTSESDGENTEGSDELVDAGKTPSMMECAKLYLDASAVHIEAFSPPNGRAQISGCNEVDLAPQLFQFLRSNMLPAFCTVLPPYTVPRYLVASDCSGAGTLNYCMPGPESSNWVVISRKGQKVHQPAAIRP